MEFLKYKNFKNNIKTQLRLLKFQNSERCYPVKSLKQTYITILIISFKLYINRTCKYCIPVFCLSFDKMVRTISKCHCLYIIKNEILCIKNIRIPIFPNLV